MMTNTEQVDTYLDCIRDTAAGDSTRLAALSDLWNMLSYGDTYGGSGYISGTDVVGLGCVLQAQEINAALIYGDYTAFLRYQ